ncbi:MAG: glycosyltransferase family 87 protein [Terracidiphilus sp.]
MVDYVLDFERHGELRVNLVMQRMKRIALAWILVSCGLSVIWGYVIQTDHSIEMVDYKGVYYDTRCLLQHIDTFKEGEPLRAFLNDAGVRAPLSIAQRKILERNIYFPTTLILIAPIAMLPWGISHLLWMGLTAGCISIAAFLMWKAGGVDAPVISCSLICLLLANCEVLFGTGNLAGVAISLCIVASWCLISERIVLIGILCLAVSLAIKPHDAGWVWLYFLLAGGIYRKRALQTLLVTLGMAVPAILWVSSIAPNWLSELHSNLLEVAGADGLSNPALISITGLTANMVIDIQSIVSVFRDEPHFYNIVSYLLCGAMLLIWSFYTLRSKFSPQNAWLALAAVVPITIIICYHRPYDAKLLLLTVPACAILCAEGGPIGRLALLVNIAGFVLTSDITLAVLSNIYKNSSISSIAGVWGKILTVLVVRPAPLVLLAMAIFYLWVYSRRACILPAVIKST